MLSICARCAHAVWPPRLLCPRCASSEWHAEPAGGGVVEELTVLGPVVDGADSVRLAAVRCDLGPRVIARVAHAVEPGDRVTLGRRGGSVVAHLSETPWPPRGPRCRP
jgi:uncharacterized OB-fold protein